MSDSVQLIDFDVIARYSIAIRTAAADRYELIATLRADLNWLERDQIRPRPAPVDPPAETEAPEPEATIPPPPKQATKKPAKNAPAKRTTAKKAPAKKASAKKTAAAGAPRRATAH